MRKLQTFWQNLHLRAKFLLILLVGIVIIGVDAIATLLIPLRAYDEQLYESSSQMISLYAEQIKAIRTKLGLTQRQYADKLGVSLGSLKQWEQNRKQIFKSTWEKYFKQGLEKHELS